MDGFHLALHIRVGELEGLWRRVCSGMVETQMQPRTRTRPYIPSRDANPYSDVPNRVSKQEHNGYGMQEVSAGRQAD